VTAVSFNGMDPTPLIRPGDSKLLGIRPNKKIKKYLHEKIIFPVRKIIGKIITVCSSALF